MPTMPWEFGRGRDVLKITRSEDKPRQKAEDKNIGKRGIERVISIKLGD